MQVEDPHKKHIFLKDRKKSGTEEMETGNSNIKTGAGDMKENT